MIATTGATFGTFRGGLGEISGLLRKEGGESRTSAAISIVSFTNLLDRAASTDPPGISPTLDFLRG